MYVNRDRENLGMGRGGFTYRKLRQKRLNGMIRRQPQNVLGRNSGEPTNGETAWMEDMPTNDLLPVILQNPNSFYGR